MGAPAVLTFLLFLMLAEVTIVRAADGGIVQVQSVEPAARNGSRYNASSVAGRKDGGGGGGGGGGSSGGSSELRVGLGLGY
ncbi:hypothetical protein PR202_ga17023 [Eleusine coracana subsp. coracana]|uniref:Glycine-rich protein n=1 Tax=Eleusine coracana subsp. coracana TaxID=191504 RepID=A0AAV5CP44_ELECO|nr:hypothetical protein PR202_ga17023 [Eleusine coracana subsp. coracana]